MLQQQQSKAIEYCGLFSTCTPSPPPHSPPFDWLEVIFVVWLWDIQSKQDIILYCTLALRFPSQPIPILYEALTIPHVHIFRCKIMDCNVIFIVLLYYILQLKAFDPYNWFLENMPYKWIGTFAVHITHKLNTSNSMDIQFGNKHLQRQQQPQQRQRKKKYQFRFDSIKQYKTHN